MDDPTTVLLLCTLVAWLTLRYLASRRRPGGATPSMQHSRSWTTSLTDGEATAALRTFAQRTGYSVDADAQKRGLTVLADGDLAASYGQLFPVSLSPRGAGTDVKVGISAKDPTLAALADAVLERRLDTFARVLRAMFDAAEQDAGRLAAS
jgi:hypothetical protein